MTTSSKKEKEKDKRGIYLQPGEKISDEILEKLRLVNQTYSQTKDFQRYKKDLLMVFNLQTPKITNESKHYIAGFLEGEGSLNAGIKKNTTSRFGLYIDPEFSVTQHVNGISNLYLILCFFQTGRIRNKPNSNATFVYSIENRISLEQKVLPFYEQYTLNFQVVGKHQRVRIFQTLLMLFREKAHLDEKRLLYEVLPLWDKLRMQKGQKNQSFPDLLSAQLYVQQCSGQRKIE